MKTKGRHALRRLWHRVFGHGTVVARPPNAPPLLAYMGGFTICGCGKQLGWWDAERGWHQTKQGGEGNAKIRRA